jgi:carbonic anhydrase
MAGKLACGCCADLLSTRFDRRRFLQMSCIAATTVALPSVLFAAESKYEAMVLSCIDPRFPEFTRDYTNSRGLTGKFSQFVIAGAAIGVVAPKFEAWQPAFWDNLAASVQLHRISKVIAINHRDCGAARIAYGDDKVANRDLETTTHEAALTQFRAEVAKRQPELAVETGLIDLDGKVEMFG